MPAGVETTPPRRLALTRWGALLALAGVAGLVMRIWVYRTLLGTPNADEAVVGLMTRHAAEGELTTFYWGQAYGGTQEVLLTVPLFLIAGSSWLALRIVPIALGAVTALLIWRVGRRTIGEPAARVAAALFWIWPPFVLFQLVHQQGFYASNVFYGSLLLLLALRVVEQPSRVRVGVFAFVLGLAFWQTAQIVPVAAGVIGWTIWKQPRSLRHLWVAVPAAALGALPLIVWNVGHDWESFVQGDYGDKVRSLRLLASPILPTMVGLRAPYSTELLLPKALTYLIYAGLVALFAYGAIKTRRQSISILYVVATVFPFVYMLSPKTSWALSAPRFIVVLAPVMALLVAQVATRYWRAVTVLALALVVSVVTLQRMDTWFHGYSTNTKALGPRQIVQLVPRDLRPLISKLQTLGLAHVYSEYWLAYRLTFDSQERIVAAENTSSDFTFERGQVIPAPNLDSRYPAYEQEVRRARHGFVFYREWLARSSAAIDQLERQGYRRHDVGGFVVYAPGEASAPP